MISRKAKGSDELKMKVERRKDLGNGMGNFQ
jgi:hypothetical protein